MILEVSTPTIAFSAGIDDALWVVGKPSEVDAILLALELLSVFALLAVVDLQGLIVLRDEAELACVVEVERSDRVRFLVCAWSKPLMRVSENRTSTLAGRASDSLGSEQSSRLRLKPSLLAAEPDRVGCWLPL